MKNSGYKIKIADGSAIFFAKKTEKEVSYFKIKRGYKNVY